MFTKSKTYLKGLFDRYEERAKYHVDMAYEHMGVNEDAVLYHLEMANSYVHERWKLLSEIMSEEA